MNRDEILERYFEKLEIRVERSGYSEAADIIEQIRGHKPDIDSLVLFLSERTQFQDIMYGAADEDIPFALQIWSDILDIVYNEKGKLLACAQKIISNFGGIGKVLDVQYDEVERSLVWKVKFDVDDDINRHYNS